MCQLVYIPDLLEHGFSTFRRILVRVVLLIVNIAPFLKSQHTLMAILRYAFLSLVSLACNIGSHFDALDIGSFWSNAQYIIESCILDHCSCCECYCQRLCESCCAFKVNQWQRCVTLYFLPSFCDKRCLGRCIAMNVLKRYSR